MNAKILIVDDSSLARRTSRRILEQIGLTVEEATGGAQALEQFFLNRPDLVLLDMVMTGMYGLDVLTKLRELDPSAKVIVATADVQKSTREQVKAAGAVAFVNKPLDAAEVKAVIAKVLQGGDTWI
jgi:two-component system chemotaxis response regulator CheY